MEQRDMKRAIRRCANDSSILDAVESRIALEGLTVDHFPYYTKGVKAEWRKFLKELCDD